MSLLLLLIFAKEEVQLHVSLSSIPLCRVEEDCISSVSQIKEGRDSSSAKLMRGFVLFCSCCCCFARIMHIIMDLVSWCMIIRIGISFVVASKEDFNKPKTWSIACSIAEFKLHKSNSESIGFLISMGSRSPSSVQLHCHGCWWSLCSSGYGISSSRCQSCSRFFPGQFALNGTSRLPWSIRTCRWCGL